MLKAMIGKQLKNGGKLSLNTPKFEKYGLIDLEKCFNRLTA